MRTGISISALILSFLFLTTACEKEKEDGSQLLEGKWNQLSTLRIDYIDNVKQNETTFSYQTGKLVLQIADDGTAKRFTDGVLSDSFYWIVDGNLFITTSNSGVELKYEFSVSELDMNLKWALQSTVDGHVMRSDYSATYKKAE